MTETELRKHRCCFSGHRPEKLKITEKELARLQKEKEKCLSDIALVERLHHLHHRHGEGDRPGGRRDRPAPAGA